MSYDHGGMPPKRRENKTKAINRQIIESRGAPEYDTIPFIKGSNNLWVFINGKKEYLDYDYIELSNNRIKLLKDVPYGSIIECLVFDV